MEPSAAVEAIADEVIDFSMPGAGIAGFVRKAALMARAGIYDLRSHRDEVVLPILRYWRIFERAGLTAAAEQARQRLADHLDALETSARRFEAKVAASNERRAAQAGT